MDVLQTTSTEDFNSAFDYKKQRAQNTLVAGSIKPKYDIESVLEAAVSLYTTMMQDGTWLGKDHKAKEIALKASIDANDSGRGRGKGPCFNCGSTDHQIANCPKPPNLAEQERRKAEQKAIWKQNRANRRANQGRGQGRGRGGRGRGGGRGGGGRGTPGRGDPTGKFCPPAPYENNLRNISIRGQIVPYKWDDIQRRWNPVAVAQAQPAPVSASDVTVHTSNTTSAGSTATAPQQRAHIANLQQQLNSTFTNLLHSVQD